jgi:hypothetical protein
VLSLFAGVSAREPSQSGVSTPTSGSGRCTFCGDDTSATGAQFCSDECTTNAKAFNSSFMSPQHDGPASRAGLKPVPTKGKSAFEPLNGDDELADPPKLRNTALIGAVDSFVPTGCKAPSPFLPAAQCEPILAGRVGTAISAASRGIDSVTPPPIDADYPSATPIGAFGTSLSPSDAQLHEPSVCIPWVSPEVGREVIVSTFEQFGTVKQVDLVPREDHFLCFVHFDKWNVEDPAVHAVRVRLWMVVDPIC